ncbi:MAG: hypothetical protein E3J67_00340 [Dehalococcoidia bacterium]|nr:MAG: hypothetical protein E3J67_00340 [Dehalococcoidia bacterium]
MQCGCVSLGGVKCDGCQRVIPYLGRYLIVEEEGAVLRLCVDCCLKKGCANYKQDKGEQVLTFFTGEG